MKFVTATLFVLAAVLCLANVGQTLSEDKEDSDLILEILQNKKVKPFSTTDFEHKWKQLQQDGHSAVAGYLENLSIRGIRVRSGYGGKSLTAKELLSLDWDEAKNVVVFSLEEPTGLQPEEQIAHNRGLIDAVLDLLQDFDVFSGSNDDLELENCETTVEREMLDFLAFYRSEIPVAEQISDCLTTTAAREAAELDSFFPFDDLLSPLRLLLAGSVAGCADPDYYEGTGIGNTVEKAFADLLLRDFPDSVNVGYFDYVSVGAARVRGRPSAGFQFVFIAFECDTPGSDGGDDSSDAVDGLA